MDALYFIKSFVNIVLINDRALLPESQLLVLPIVDIEHSRKVRQGYASENDVFVNGNVDRHLD